MTPAPVPTPVPQARARVRNRLASQAPLSPMRLAVLPALPIAFEPTRRVPLDVAAGDIRAKLIPSNAHDVVALTKATQRSVFAALLAAVEGQQGRPGHVYKDVGEIIDQVPTMVEHAMTDPSLLATFVYSKGRHTFKSVWPVRALLWGTSEQFHLAVDEQDERRRIGELLTLTAWDDAMDTVLRRPAFRLSSGATLGSAFLTHKDARGDVIGRTVDAFAARSPMYGGVGLRFHDDGRPIVTAIAQESVAKWCLASVKPGLAGDKLIDGFCNYPTEAKEACEALCVFAERRSERINVSISVSIRSL